MLCKRLRTVGAIKYEVRYRLKGVTSGVLLSQEDMCCGSIFMGSKF